MISGIFFKIGDSGKAGMLTCCQLKPFRTQPETALSRITEKTPKSQTLDAKSCKAQALILKYNQ